MTSLPIRGVLGGVATVLMPLQRSISARATSTGSTR